MNIKRPRKPPERKPTPLNAHMDRFCQKYLKAPDNQTDATLAAGYAVGSVCKRASVLIAVHAFRNIAHAAAEQAQAPHSGI